MTTIRHKNLAFTVKEEQEVSAFVFLYIRGVFPYKIRISQQFCGKQIQAGTSNKHYEFVKLFLGLSQQLPLTEFIISHSYL